MDAWAAFLAALLQLGLRLLEKADAARAAEFRRRVAADGAGVLLGQLNPNGGTCASTVVQSPEAGITRNARSVDEQR